MASRPRRAKVALGVITLAIVGLGAWACIWGWRPLMWLLARRVVTITIEMDGHEARGIVGVNRWTGGAVPLRVQTFYYVENGFKAHESEYWPYSGVSLRSTMWRFDGSVASQSRCDDDPGHVKEPYLSGLVSDQSNIEPPWWWGVKDQTSPSDPQWIAEHGK